MISNQKNDDLRSFDVPETVRHGNGSIFYKIVLQITPKELTENSYQIVYWKSYSDIRKLYDTLQHYHHAIYRPGKLPQLPEKSVFREPYDPTTIEKRRTAIREFLNFSSERVYLRTHEAYFKFFQNGQIISSSNIERETLQPEIISSKLAQDSMNNCIRTAVSEKHDELLVNIDDGQSSKELNNSTLIKISNDLVDL